MTINKDRTSAFRCWGLFSITPPRNTIQGFAAFKHPPDILNASPFRGRRIRSRILANTTEHSASLQIRTLWLIDTVFTGPFAVSNDRPTALFGVETEVGKSTA